MIAYQNMITHFNMIAYQNIIAYDKDSWGNGPDISIWLLRQFLFCLGTLKLHFLSLEVWDSSVLHLICLSRFEMWIPWSPSHQVLVSWKWTFKTMVSLFVWKGIFTVFLKIQNVQGETSVFKSLYTHFHTFYKNQRKMISVKKKKSMVRSIPNTWI